MLRSSLKIRPGVNSTNDSIANDIVKQDCQNFKQKQKNKLITFTMLDDQYT